MNFKEAQEEMRLAYLNGATGIFTSGIIWLIAGITAIYATNQTSIMVFFFGGMLIHPLSVVLDKILGYSGKHSKENPLGRLALESTILLFIGLFIAYTIFFKNANFFYPIMLLTIGGRYLIFQTIYGLRWYWILGVVLIGGGVFGILFDLPIHQGAILGGVIELVFSFIIGKLGKTSKI